MRLHSLPRAVAAMALTVVLGPAAANAEAHFTAKLTGQQQNPAVVTAAQGSGTFTLSAAGVQFFVTVEGLSGPITAAHIHRGAAGVNGPVVRTLNADLIGRTAAGAWTAADPEPLTAALIADLMRGDLYVNFHTAANPGGEIRGQIHLSAGTSFFARLHGTQENPPLAVGGTGTGTFLYTEEGNLYYAITVQGLTGAISAAHFHRSPIGVNGGVDIDITASFGGGNTAVGVVPLTPAQRTQLFIGNYYVNVHTAANPGGEIRGQVLLAGGFGLSARLDQSQEVPPTGVAGTGTASATLTGSGLVIDTQVTGLTGAITVAHIHRGPPGVAGPPVRTLTFAANASHELWHYSDAEPLTPALIAELLAGNLYVNVHTAAFGGGEIRGQLTLNHPPGPGRTFTALITQAQEEPASGVAGTGVGTFTLTPAGLVYRITLNGLTGALTAAHFHANYIGANGGVVKTITPAFAGTNTATGIWAPGDPEPLSAARITELLRGQLYVNFHTAAFPGGEIRGQVLPASGAPFRAYLTGQQEVPPLAAILGTGVSAGTLANEGLYLTTTVTGLTGAITAAHIHRGPPGVAGAVVRTITGDFTGLHAQTVWKPTDAEPLSAALILEALRGNLYVNIHTAANPGGEIRGQLLISGGEGRNALLHGTAEVPEVATAGYGSAAMTLTDQGVPFRLSVNDLNSPFSSAHFHNEAAGFNGPVVRDISGEFSALTGDGVWQPSDAMALTPTLLGQFYLDRIYLNVHTTSEPGGEVRGDTKRRTVAGVDPIGSPGGALELACAPNPALGHARFTFRLAEATRARLRIYDVSGREVATVADRAFGAGRQGVSFATSGLQSGVYLYRLDAGGVSRTRRMVVLR